MTLALGTVPAGTTLYIPFATYAGATGASVTMTGLAVTDVEIYKNGSTTQRASDAGYALLDTDGIDFDGVTGIHGFSIDLSDNTDSGFYAVGSWYWVVVSAVTVDSQTVNFIAAVFRIGPAESVAGYPKADVSHFGGTAGTFASGRPEVNTTHVAGTSQTAGDIIGDTNDIQSRLPAALVSGRMDSSVGAMASNVITAAATAADYLAEINAEVDTAISDAALATAANLATVAGYLDTEIAAILADTNELQTDWADGGRLDLILDARASQASVNTIDGIVDDILVDTAEIGAAGAGLTAVASAANLATLAGYVDTEVAAIKAKTDNLPASPAATGDIPTAASIADAVWDEAASGHVGAGSFGKALGDTDERGANTVVRGTADTGATTTSIPTSAFSPAGGVADQFKGRIVVFDNDTATAALRGQATDITASSNAATPTLTVTALTTAPASGDSFSVL